MSPEDRSHPRATYRIQLHKDFTFEDAGAIAGYLSDLGISHLYCSPYLKARPSSRHGYDVVDHHRINDELGGEAGLASLAEILEANGLSQMLDIVPNHMAVTPALNRWWWDVLAKGRDSRFASFFDIDWNPPQPYLREKVLVPVLGGHLGDVVAAGDLELVEQDGEPVLTYFEHRFPLAAGTSTRKPRNEEEMLELLARQHYRLAYWRVAADEINYRRFFDINDFAALCMERPEVFEETHRRIVGLVRTGIVTALRVDHVDGLKDPRGYIERLRDACKPPYLIVEKILGRQETLPAAWDVEGTTGYDMLNVVGGLFVDPRAETPLGELYRKFTGETRSFPELEREKKTLVCNTVLAADVDRLAHQLRALLERRPRTRDFSLRQVREALVAVFSELEVYRTYVRAGESPSRQDVSYVQAACARAAGRVRAGRELLEVVEELLLDPADEDTAELVARFQQVSGPVAAKGVEDTAFYGYGRLIALNEVGGDPGRFGVSPAEFHRECERRQSHHPHALIATSTHDTKRSEDVRARLMLLSEIPDEWAGAVRRWSAANERHKTRGVPEPAAEYFLYQTLVGAHPLEVERAAAYMHKAAKEAKTRTSWVDPDPAYEEALERFVGSVLSDPAFLAELDAFTAPLIAPGRINSLSQVLLKVTAPGIPDIYQGTEIWDLSLVDPDNRRPVDYGLRRSLLAEAVRLPADRVWARADEGLPKLFLTHRALQLRAERPHAFGGSATYEPLKARGPKEKHVVAFTRSDEVIAVAPRLVMTLGGDWADTFLPLPQGVWRDVLGGRRFSGSAQLSELTHDFPVALLARG